MGPVAEVGVGFFSLMALKGTVRGTTSVRNSRLSRRETALAGWLLVSAMVWKRIEGRR
jgi:hypothetical protein